MGHFWRNLLKKLGTNLNFSSTYHPQTNGQTKVVNRSLVNILRSLVSEHPKQWDQVLAHAEFAYNDSPNRSTGLSPFQILHRMHPKGIYELRNLGKQEVKSVDGEYFAVSMQELQERFKQQQVQIERRFEEKIARF